MSTNPNVVSPQTAHKLAINNLLHVFSERDASKRLEAVKATYTLDVHLSEPDGILVGHEAVSEKAGDVLDKQPGWRFTPKGKVKQNGEMIYLAWEFGPAVEGKELGEVGSVKVMATGADVILTAGGLISRLWVVIDGLSDVSMPQVAHEAVTTVYTNQRDQPRQEITRLQRAAREAENLGLEQDRLV
ncbi:hypothetical protein PV08_10025 [Exophiala spinifera]|uniref:SnoaL-like domain-containing protein n=1 Tax=Exophiala spinifera TaxID=91928 RepID=A0A0D1Y746_9EURO|nr:uncharacterized protein PV08_10025 [Exophiala spinifera]KIW10726.1 hypothetical protein PV08_10025 [Exophiala spinifera]